MPRLTPLYLMLAMLAQPALAHAGPEGVPGWYSKEAKASGGKNRIAELVAATSTETAPSVLPALGITADPEMPLLDLIAADLPTTPSDTAGGGSAPGDPSDWELAGSGSSGGGAGAIGSGRAVVRIMDAVALVNGAVSTSNASLQFGQSTTREMLQSGGTAPLVTYDFY